ncbi:hypothetical protein L873DRAFT_1809888, partial [Choiromyces venosus 120613-1]
MTVYHTGAGINDLTFRAEPGSKAFLNETQLQWDLNTPDIPWGTYFSSPINYVAWKETTADIGYGLT